jgi:hypothetical protein
MKDPTIELAGVSKDLCDSSTKANHCLKCGKGNYKWLVCPEPSPVTKGLANAGKKHMRNWSTSPSLKTNKPMAVGSLESLISYSETSLTKK